MRGNIIPVKSAYIKSFENTDEHISDLEENNQDCIKEKRENIVGNMIN